MKITLSGSLGHVSKPLAKELVQNGHAITVISSKPEMQKEIEGLGAVAAIGSVEDTVFLTSAFNGADAVYCMIPPNHFGESDAMAYYRRIGNSYAQAIKQSGVKRVVHLSSFGTHLDKGTGFVLGSRLVENMLDELPDVAITHMRPTSFYYNLYSFVNMIKGAGFIAANYGGDQKLPWVSPIDIAAAIADEITAPLVGRNVRYVASDELTGNEIASILGAAIGKLKLKWIVISDEQWQSALETNGVPPHVAANLVELFASFQSGALAEDYHRHSRFWAT